MYSLYDYGWMISDRGRTTAYLEALKRRVTRDSVVVEIGTGAGVLAMLAARLGARKVYAIESSGIIEFARRLAAANGLTDRIEFFRRMSTQVDLPEKADIIVAEIHGILPIFQQGLPSLMDARDRFLSDGGSFIPQSETLWAALVETPDLYHKMTGVWGSDIYGIDMTALRTPAASYTRKNYFEPGVLASSPQCWAELNYSTLRSASVHGEMAWEVEANRTVHGFCAWFDWEGAEDVRFSNSPLSGEQHIFGQLYFPWPTPVELNAGDRVCIGLDADMVGQDYVWRWKTLATDRHGKIKAAFQQSTFEGSVPLPEVLRKRAHSYTPTLNEDGSVHRLILSRIGSGATLEQIACEVSASFPSLFPRWTDALTRWVTCQCATVHSRAVPAGSW